MNLVRRGLARTLLLAGTDASLGRTSGHLSSVLDDGYTVIAQKHGTDGAKRAAESQEYAVLRVGEIAKELGIECEYRVLPAYHFSQYPTSQKKEHDEEVQQMKSESEKSAEVGLDAHFDMGRAVKGWDGKIDQRDALVYGRQATFHPTKYLNGLLAWLKQQPTFHCYTHTRVVDVSERGVEILGVGNKDVRIQTEGGNTVTCKDAVEATCVPLQKLAVIAQMEYFRTYCIAIRIPRGVVEDVQIYDEHDPYKYMRMTSCDERDDYMIVGGCDHKVGQESTAGRFEELEQWIRDRFTKAGSVDYKWSGQIFQVSQLPKSELYCVYWDRFPYRVQRASQSGTHSSAMQTSLHAQV